MESTRYTVNGREFELQHHGVKGMKWGVRRYQKKDGSLTPAGKKRYGDNPDADSNDGSNRAQSKKVAKRVAAALVMTATAAAAVAVYRKNPDAVKSVLSKVGKSTVAGAKKTCEIGKKYVKEAGEGVKEGVKSGIRNAPKKAAEAVITGATMMAVKRMLDSTVGKEEAARIFQANNKKKIGSFWKVGQEDRDDDD